MFRVVVQFTQFMNVGVIFTVPSPYIDMLMQICGKSTVLIVLILFLIILVKFEEIFWKYPPFQSNCLNSFQTQFLPFILVEWLRGRYHNQYYPIQILPCRLCFTNCCFTLDGFTVQHTRHK